jgi:2-dehydro-3-deoxygluconokinase
MQNFLSIGECMIELASLGGDMMRKGFAGDTFNTAWYAQACRPEGWTVDYFTALGDDRASGEMLEFIQAAGVGTGHIKRMPGKAPGLYMIHLDKGERSFSYWRSVSAARELANDGDALAAAIDAADTVYFSGITLAILPPEGRNTLITLAAAARQEGKTVAFDPNLRPRLGRAGTLCWQPSPTPRAQPPSCFPASTTRRRISAMLAFRTPSRATAAWARVM